MRKMLAAAFMALCLPARASWVRQFNVSTQQYRLFIESSDKTGTTTGFYLTSFPCYSQNGSEYYKTLPGQNSITLYCLEPPREIYLSYLTKRAGSFFSKNDDMAGYMFCPVKISGQGVNSVVPRLAVAIEDCEKKVLNPKANREMLSKGVSGAGKTVSDMMEGDGAPLPPSGSPQPAETLYRNQLGAESAPRTDGNEERAIQKSQ
ncbi:MAG: hypothetical protein LBO78_01410 [Rickettsiales bacterium]|jgi:hypothetical protein|nr:hypothetical protein [Rickettsiales bacterium]